MARRWHVAAHNRQKEHQEHGRIAHVVLRHTEVHGGLFVIIFTCVELSKIHMENQQIVRAGFAVTCDDKYSSLLSNLSNQYYDHSNS